MVTQTGVEGVGNGRVGEGVDAVVQKRSREEG